MPGLHGFIYSGPFLDRQAQDERLAGLEVLARKESATTLVAGLLAKPDTPPWQAACVRIRRTPRNLEAVQKLRLLGVELIVAECAGVAQT